MAHRNRLPTFDSSPWLPGEGFDRRNRRTTLNAALLLACCLAWLPLRAHDFWIEPDRFLFDAPAPVAVTLRVGQDFKGDSVPYVDDWVERFEIHDNRGTRPFVAQIGDDPAGASDVRAPGLTWIAYQSRDDFIELPPDKFRDYLLLEGMDYILPLRERRGLAERPAREYYVRCVKSLLWWPGGDSDNPTEPLGLTLEIVPLANPYAPTAARNTLDVRLLHAGRPAAGLLVKAFTREAPQERQLQRTDSDGRAQLQIDRPGHWIVTAVHMVAVDGDPYGDWRSYWASLTFGIDG